MGSFVIDYESNEHDCFILYGIVSKRAYRQLGRGKDFLYKLRA